MLSLTNWVISMQRCLPIRRKKYRPSDSSHTWTPVLIAPAMKSNHGLLKNTMAVTSFSMEKTTLSLRHRNSLNFWTTLEKTSSSPTDDPAGSRRQGWHCGNSSSHGFTCWNIQRLNTAKFVWPSIPTKKSVWEHIISMSKNLDATGAIPWTVVKSEN